MMTINKVLFVGLLATLTACQSNQLAYDASGVFEADPIIVAAEANGVIDRLDLEEGQVLKAGQLLGTIDCATVDLQKQQVEASIAAVAKKQTNVAPQVDVLIDQIKAQQAQLAILEEQEQVLAKEQQRIANLVQAEALPSQKLDEINGQVAILKKQQGAAQEQIKVLEQQIKAQKRTASTVNSGVLSEQEPLRKQVALLDEQMSRCTIQSPIDGTILAQYAHAKEMTGMGRPLFKIANLEELILRAYITGDQLMEVKLQQKVKVYTDQMQEGDAPLEGTITWISDQSEFTPKTIQTKEERANLVYAMKVVVPNNGYLKVGMYGEISFQ